MPPGPRNRSTVPAAVAWVVLVGCAVGVAVNVRRGGEARPFALFLTGAVCAAAFLGGRAVFYRIMSLIYVYEMGYRHGRHDDLMLDLWQDSDPEG